MEEVPPGQQPLHAHPCPHCGKELPPSGLCDTCDGKPSFLNSVLLLLGPVTLMTILWLVGFSESLQNPRKSSDLTPAMTAMLGVLSLVSLVTTVIVSRRIARRFLKMPQHKKPTLSSVVLTLAFTVFFSATFAGLQFLLLLTLVFGSCFCGKGGSHL